MIPSVTARVGRQPRRALRAFAAASLVGSLVVGLSACGGSSSSTAPPGPAAGASSPSAAAAQASAAVQIASFNYAPQTVTIKAGGAVTWSNHDPYPHTASIAAGGQGPAQFSTQTLNKGQSKTVTFTKPGTYSYVCLFHQFMHGTVVVR